MSNISCAIEMYVIEHRRLPEALEVLDTDDRLGRPYMKEIPLDPWGSSFRYTILDGTLRRFELVSAGEDREWDTDDDLRWPKVER